MKNAFEELGIASLGLFLSLGLSLNVYAQTEVVKSVESQKTAESAAHTNEQMAAPEAVPAPKDTPQPPQKDSGPMLGRDLTVAPQHDPAPGENGDMNGGSYGQPPPAPREISDFNRQFKKDVPFQANQILKDLKGLTVGDVKEWKASLATILSDAKKCVSDMAQAAPEDKRDIMNECYGKNFHREMDDIRQKFVPKSELDNEFRQMKDQERELNRFLNNLIGSPKSEKRRRLSTAEPIPVVKQITALLGSIDANRKSIQNPGDDTDQRSALEAYRSENQGTWDEINKLRAVIEIPQQLKDAKTQLKYATAQVNPAPRKDGSFGPIPFEKAANFFGVDLKALQSAVSEKAQIISDIESAVANGEAETAQSLMQENIYNGWHPGDLRGVLEMMKGAYQQTKAIRDNEFREQIIAIIDPIVESVNAAEFRDAREAMEQVNNEMHKYERYFNGPQRSGSNKKMDTAFDKLEKLMMKKFEKYMGNDPQEGGDEFEE